MLASEVLLFNDENTNIRCNIEYEPAMSYCSDKSYINITLNGVPKYKKGMRYGCIDIYKARNILHDILGSLQDPERDWFTENAKLYNTKVFSDEDDNHNSCLCVIL